MKLYIRLLLTIPFVVVAFGYYQFYNPDEKCLGLIDVIIILVFYGFLLLTGILALVGTLRKKQSDKQTPEPITFSISLVTFLFLIYNFTFRGHTHGDKWIYAENKNLDEQFPSQDLSLRKNGNFTFSPNLDCSISGEYKKIGDTIIFDKETIDRTNKQMTTTYLLKSNKLTPLFDTVNKITFTITETE